MGSNSDWPTMEKAAERTPELQAWPVDRRVNNARNEGEELIDAAGDTLCGARRPD